MKNLITIILLQAFLSLSIQSLQAQIPSKTDQINAAVMAGPDNLRSTATVWGYDSDGKFVKLRAGTSPLTCLADDPNKPGFSVACYHSSLDEFMARGRALKAENESKKEIDDTREAEAKSGQLKMPEKAAGLHILFGKEAFYNSEKGIVENGMLRYVVYIPWATQETSGLPLKPMVPGGPWIMDPGTHKAHIMISPPPPSK